MKGNDLVKKLISATGLPATGPQNQLEKLIADSGYDLNEITLDQLRTVLAQYLQDVLLAADEQYSN